MNDSILEQHLNEIDGEYPQARYNKSNRRIIPPTRNIWESENLDTLLQALQNRPVLDDNQYLAVKMHHSGIQWLGRPTYCRYHTAEEAEAIVEFLCSGCHRLERVEWVIEEKRKPAKVSQVPARKAIRFSRPHQRGDENPNYAGVMAAG